MGNFWSKVFKILFKILLVIFGLVACYLIYSLEDIKFERIIAICGIVFASCSALAAWFNYKATEGQREINQNLQMVKYLEYKAQLLQKIHKCDQEICECDDISKAKPLLEKRNEVYVEFYDFFENLCYYYNKNSIDKVYFKKMYKETIIQIVELQNGKDISETYDEMAKVYREFTGKNFGEIPIKELPKVDEVETLDTN